MSATRSSLQSLLSSAGQMRERIASAIQGLNDIPPVVLGSCPRENVYQQDKVILYRYRSKQPVSQRAAVPLLICYAMVNGPEILDLQTDRSLIRGLLARGNDVYLIDWGRPGAPERYLDMAHYIEQYLAGCVEYICAAHRLSRIHLLGVCQGGTLSLCYAALHPQRLQTLTTMVTPVDFCTPENLLSKWVREVDIDALVAAHGNIPATLLNSAFVTLQPFRLLSQKYVNVLDSQLPRADLENFLRMEKWIFDSPDQPGEMFRQFIKTFYQENQLARRTLQLRGVPVDLGAIKAPVLNIYATEDHLVPPSATLPLEDYIGSRDYQVHAFAGGHIGMYVSRRAQQEVPDVVSGWLSKHSGNRT